jgi:hypothetical protein
LIRCERNINECSSQPCKNGAECIDSANRYICQCLQGTSGVNCEIDIDECASRPCLNGATCVTPFFNMYECLCPIGFSGVNCQNRQNTCNPNPCQNGGMCTALQEGKYRCMCEPNYSGINCEIYVGPCIGPQCFRNITISQVFNVSGLPDGVNFPIYFDCLKNVWNSLNAFSKPLKPRICFFFFF